MSVFDYTYTYTQAHTYTSTNTHLYVMTALANASRITDKGVSHRVQRSTNTVYVDYLKRRREEETQTEAASLNLYREGFIQKLLFVESRIQWQKLSYCY